MISWLKNLFAGADDDAKPSFGNLYWLPKFNCPKCKHLVVWPQQDDECRHCGLDLRDIRRSLPSQPQNEWDAQDKHLIELVNRVCSIPFSEWTQRCKHSRNGKWEDDTTTWSARSPGGLEIGIISSSSSYNTDDGKSTCSFALVVDGKEEYKSEQPIIGHYAMRHLEEFCRMLSETKRQQDAPLRSANEAAAAERQRKEALRAEQKSRETLSKW